ncbi:MAG: hypothetical protein ACRC3G_00340, partial [Bacteroidales bacterium]
SPTAPTQQIVQVSLVLAISDTKMQKTIVTQTEIKGKGVGENEDAAIINAIQQIEIRNANLKRFIELAKMKITGLISAEPSELNTNISSTKQCIEVDTSTSGK